MPFSRRIRTTVQARRDRNATLALESLEDRLALAVDVSLDSGNLLVVGDDAADKVVIEERGANNLEKWVYVGGKLVGGAPFIATAGGVTVDLGGGNDSLTIRSGNEGYIDAELFYTIDLGEGNNTLTFQAGAMADSDLYLESITSGAGRDQVFFQIGNANNSRIMFDGSAGADLGAGDDRFSVSWKSLVESTLRFTAGETPYGVDLGAGNDLFEVKRGDAENSQLYFGVDLGGYVDETDVDAGFTNVVKIGGKSTLSGGALAEYSVYGAAGVDQIAYDDERILGDQTEAALYFDLGDANDVVALKFDGLRKSETGIGNEAGDYSLLSLYADLGDGADVFTETFSPSYWRLQNGTEFSQDIAGGEGDDRIVVGTTSRTRTLNLDGLFDLRIAGEAGENQIAVSLPKVLRIGVGRCLVDVSGGDENDQISVTVNFVAASRNDPARGEDPTAFDDYSAVIQIDAGAGEDAIIVKMNNASPTLIVLISIFGDNDEGDVTTTDLVGLYEFPDLG